MKATVNESKLGLVRVGWDWLLQDLDEECLVPEWLRAKPCVGLQYSPDDLDDDQRKTARQRQFIELGVRQHLEQARCASKDNRKHKAETTLPPGQSPGRVQAGY